MLITVKMYLLVYYSYLFIYCLDENDRLKENIHILEEKLKACEQVCYKWSEEFSQRNSNLSFSVFLGVNAVKRINPS